MYCNKCGNKLNPDARYCDNCGAPVFEGNNNPKAAHSNYTSVEKKVNIIILLLLIISVAVFFTKTGINGLAMFSSLSSYEPTIATVPIFFLSLFNCLFFIFRTSERPYSFFAVIGGINTVLSLILIIPDEFNIQYVCIGTYIIFIANLFIAILSILMKRYTYMNANKQIEKQITNAVFHNLRSHRRILQVISLIAISTFFMPMALTSCSTDSAQTSTGIDLINSFDHGIGNGYTIAVLVVFLTAFTLLFVKKRALLPVCFVCGIVGIISIIMSKFIFKEYIVKYLIGSYLAFVCSLIMALVGYKLYKKGKDLYKSIESRYIK